MRHLAGEQGETASGHGGRLARVWLNGVACLRNQEEEERPSPLTTDEQGRCSDEDQRRGKGGGVEPDRSKDEPATHAQETLPEKGRRQQGERDKRSPGRSSLETLLPEHGEKRGDGAAHAKRSELEANLGRTGVVVPHDEDAQDPDRER
jgi:hypothetical protein